MDYETIICFETHVELGTRTKLFCDCAVEEDAPPNTRICPVCSGQPGALPVLNRKAVEHTVRAGLALNCTINTLSRFARKNYFYPDLPKGYQISQYARPFCENGFMEIEGSDGLPYRVGIKRIHLEEDAGKLVHFQGPDPHDEFSLVDYNRSSVPLLEIVTDHTQNPLRTLEEARRYLEKLQQTLRYIEVSKCVIEKGQFRCDVNVSIRPKGSRAFGNRTEIKNMASFRFMLEAIEFEIKRQAAILDAGEEVSQETRRFDEKEKVTFPMRSKEDAPDYRYFPDPDLVEIELDDDFVNKVRDSMPELPHQKVQRMILECGLSEADALVLTKDKNVAVFFENCLPHCRDPRKLGLWIGKDLFSLLKEASVTIEACPITHENLASLVNLISQGAITDKIGRTVLREMFASGKDPQTIIEEKGLKPIQDVSILGSMVEEVMAENPETVAQLRGGKEESIHFFIGQVMRRTKGRADAKLVRDIIRKKIS